MYYLNHLSGAAAIFWEQGLGNQWMIPGPGKHPVQLSPFGRATEDFLAFAQRLPDRGEPVTPVGILLSYGHGYDRVNNACKMLDQYPESDADRELRELFNVCWHPAGVLEGQPAAPDVQSMPGGRYGNIFDILVDRPERAVVLKKYPVIWAAGDVNLAAMAKPLEEYVKAGGTLVLTSVAAPLAEKKARWLPDAMLGFAASNTFDTFSDWKSTDGTQHTTTPFRVERGILKGARILATAGKEIPLVIRNAVGNGAVITVLVPRGLGIDERAHPVLPFLMNGLTRDILPVSIETTEGKPLSGEVMYQVNRTKDGLVVLLMNNRGVDKTQHGIARVDRRQFADVVIRTKEPLKLAKEWTTPRNLSPVGGTLTVRVHPGDVQVIGLVTK